MFDSFQIESKHLICFMSIICFIDNIKNLVQILEEMLNVVLYQNKGHKVGHVHVAQAMGASGYFLFYTPLGCKHTLNNNYTDHVPFFIITI